MSSLAIPDFSADFGRDSGNFNFQTKARPDAQRETQRAERYDDVRDASIREPADDRRERNDFDRALRDAADTREPQKIASREPLRDRAPADDVQAKDKAEPVSKTDAVAADQVEKIAQTPADAAAQKPAFKTANAKPQAKQGQQADAAQTIALERSTQVVIAKKPDAAAPAVATQQAEASDLSNGETLSSDGKNAADPAATKTDACAAPIQPNANAAANAQAQNATDAAASAAIASLLNAMNAPAQTPNQQPAANTSQNDPVTAPVVEPELLGAAALAMAAKPAAPQIRENLAAPGEAAQAEAFNAALGKQQGPGAKPAAVAEKTDGGNHSNAATAGSNANGATSPNAPQQAALQNAVKGNEAAAPKDTSAAAPKAAAEVKAADGKTDGAQGQQFTGATGAAKDNRPTAANTTHATNNTETVAKSVVHFFRQSNGGNARFEIRLDPVELGRVDARVEVHSDKTVSLTLSADRPETLQELMRTARDLEKQLTDSGMKLSDEGVKFRLNADAQNGQGRQNAQLEAEPRRARGIYNDAEPAIDVSANVTLRRYRAGGVDVLA